MDDESGDGDGAVDVGGVPAGVDGRHGHVAAHEVGAGGQHGQGEAAGHGRGDDDGRGVGRQRGDDRGQEVARVRVTLRGLAEA